jgi:tRNA threonylcarbamoyladenosine biosynthesis protein TsaE
VVHIIKLLSESADETMEIGRTIGRCLSEGDVIGLTGDLGSGKSVIARGILRALGVEGDIPSPSFIIAARYEAKIPVNHIDLYRLASVDEAAGLGLEDLLYSEEISVIEWAEKMVEIMPEARIDIRIDLRGQKDERLVTISPSGDVMKAKLAAVAGDFIRLT